MSLFKPDFQNFKRQETGDEFRAHDVSTCIVEMEMSSEDS